MQSQSEEKDEMTNADTDEKGGEKDLICRTIAEEKRTQEEQCNRTTKLTVRRSVRR